MKKLLLISLTLTLGKGYAQTNEHPNVKLQINTCQENMSGIIITVTGQKKDKEEISNPRTRLYVRNNETATFGVINGNPFREEITINDVSVSQHIDGDSFLEILKQKATQLRDSTKQDTIYPLQKHSTPKLKALFGLLNELREYKFELTVQKCITPEDVLGRIVSYYSIFEEGRQILKNPSLIISTEITSEGLTIYIDPVTKELTPQGKKIIDEIENEFKDFFNLRYEHTTLPLQVKNNSDYISFEVTRKQIQGGATETKTYEIWVLGGLKIDFSATAWGTALTDEAFTTKDVQFDTITRKQIIRQDAGKFAFAFGSQVNCGIRTGVFPVRPAISFGVSVNNEGNFQLKPGVTLLFGKDPRIGFTGGIAFGKVKRLDAAYEVGGYYAGESGNVPTVDKFSYAPFFGFTYNLTKPKEQKKETEK
jgi:hypothetical protein